MPDRTIFRKFRSHLDCSALLSSIETLAHLERPQTYEARIAAAAHVESLMRAAGFADVRRYEFPLDGKTVCQDKSSAGGEYFVGRLTW